MNKQQLITLIDCDFTRDIEFHKRNINIHKLVITGNHYENTSMQYTVFFCSKNENFHQKKNDIFLIFAQNIDCGYTLELPR